MDIIALVRDKNSPYNYKPRDQMSWGKVFLPNVLRQPLLAKAFAEWSMKFQLEVRSRVVLKNGGYIYADIYQWIPMQAALRQDC